MVTSVDKPEEDNLRVEKKPWSVEAARDVEDELIVVVGMKSMDGGDELTSCEVGTRNHTRLFIPDKYISSKNG